MNKKYSIGLMSGTSADGLTATLISNAPFKVICCKNYPYPKALQQKLIMAYNLKAAALAELSFEIGKQYAITVNKFLKQFKINKKDIFAVGMHGQTVTHNPYAKTPNTMQIGEPAYLSAMGLKVVYNFRVKDMVLGGQGAPLVPFFDEYVFGKGAPSVLLNIGGISNITVTGKGVKTFGFDTGPGNALMDSVLQKHSKGKIAYDKSGAIAAKGTVDETLLEKLLADNFFEQKPPKSLDRAQFGAAYMAKNIPAINSKNINNILATLNMFTAATIARAIVKFVKTRYSVKRVIISGGGVYNKTLTANIAKLLPGTKIESSAKYGVDPMAKEAAAFAVMAMLALQGKTNHCPRATGAKQKTILGSVVA
ncbi:anhydro-N-acetylmuramic acid kinase [Elusimicrobium simillimum]|uniref:anhydro-N-acetylmuramic acid kinase n=1 Tax=Elusimicrobium simillimum TaxID=3143438 RepID=UPI003C70133A